MDVCYVSNINSNTSIYVGRHPHPAQPFRNADNGERKEDKVLTMVLLENVMLLLMMMIKEC